MSSEHEHDLVIRNAFIVDGSGAPGYHGTTRPSDSWHITIVVRSWFVRVLPRAHSSADNTASLQGRLQYETELSPRSASLEWCVGQAKRRLTQAASS